MKSERLPDSEVYDLVRKRVASLEARVAYISGTEQWHMQIELTSLLHYLAKLESTHPEYVVQTWRRTEP
jgi:hypothetical protein